MSEQIIKVQAESSHWYTQDGKPAHDADLRRARKEQLLPSVTTIIKGAYPMSFFLLNWIKGQVVLAAATTPRHPNETDDQWVARVVESSNEKRDTSADWGTDFHHEVERICKGIEGVEKPYMADYVRLYRAWHAENVSEVCGMEGVVTQATLGYAGRYDFKLRIKGRGIGLGDIKTRDVQDGKKPNWYDEQAMQLVAYQMAMPPGERPEFLFSMVINRRRPEAPYLKFYTVEEVAVAERRWSACLELWKQIKQYQPKIKFD